MRRGTSEKGKQLGKVMRTGGNRKKVKRREREREKKKKKNMYSDEKGKLKERNGKENY